MKRDTTFKIILMISITLASILSFSCDCGLNEAIYRENNVRERSCSLLDLEDTATADLKGGIGKKYTILAISDLHFGKNGSKENSSRLIKWIETQSTAPDFCINLGDSADHGWDGELDEYLAFQKGLKETGVKNTYNIAGNHDLYNSGWKFWKEKIYPKSSFYRFSTEKISFYFLDAASASLGKPQLESLSQAMKSDEKYKIVSLHYPVYSSMKLGFCGLQDSNESDLLIKLFLENKVIQVIDGHTHDFCDSDFGKYREVNVPSLMAKGQWIVFTVDEIDGKMETVPTVAYELY